MPRYCEWKTVIIDGKPVRIHVQYSSAPKVEPCDYCQRKHEFLCDFEISPGKTCDKKLCRLHTGKLFGEPDKDYCPDHYQIMKREQMKIWKDSPLES
jgi:hypothetical protein